MYVHLIAAFDLWKCTNFNSNIKRNLDDSANQLIYHPKWIYYPNLLSQMRSLKLNAGNNYFFMLLNFVISFIALVCFGGIFASKLLHFYCNTLLTAFYSFSKDIAFCVFLYYKWPFTLRGGKRSWSTQARPDVERSTTWVITKFRIQFFKKSMQHYWNGAIFYPSMVS